MEDLSGSARMHKVAMTNRRSCTIGGVKDVLSFDIHEILLETEQGMLIDSLTYSDAGAVGRKGESLLTRLFR